MKQITLFLILYLSLGHFSVAFGQANWNSHYEDKNVKIEYKLMDCTDKPNDTDFKFYQIRLENKTKREINVQYNIGDTSEENFKSFILKSSEVKLGSCDDMGSGLLQFLDNNKKTTGKSISKTLLISNIKTYEL
jgi:hypothetical protein